jgi:5-methylcytosine-specific restriction endonuclease McrA
MSPLARLCRTHGCTTIITTGTRCPTHHAAWTQADNHRRNTRPIAAIYNTTQWRKTRTHVLERDHHTCVLCGEKATIADHHPTPLPACQDPYDTTNIRSLCPPAQDGSTDPVHDSRG